MKAKEKPHPGEEQHSAPDVKAKPGTSYEPNGGNVVHYSDDPGMKEYKFLIQSLKRRGESHHGHFTYDPKTDTIHALSDKGREYIKRSDAAKRAKNAQQ